VADAPRVLILTAAIGEGHDLPAQVLADGILEQEPGARVEIVDALAAVGGLTERVALDGSRFHSAWGNRMFDLEFALVSRFPPTRWLTGALFVAPASRRVAALIDSRRPDVVVSTYPGATEGLGRLRATGRLTVPAAGVITDLAALRYWAHPGIDLHLITHPESEAEVRRIAPVSAVVCVRGLTSPAFYAPPDPAGWRAQNGVPAEGSLVAVSGGGWAVGDLEGAAEAALRAGAGSVAVLCGRNEEVRSRMRERFGSEPRVVVLGFVDRMSDLLAAATVLVHSTAGLTVLEAIMRGCRVVSYGWGRAHIRANNEAFERHGLAAVPRDRAGLEPAIRAALADPAAPDESFAALPGAAAQVLRLARQAAPAPGPRATRR
jgi:processive 1,2-diacylglycerol beta-glucosyltransferase